MVTSQRISTSCPSCSEQVTRLCVVRTCICVSLTQLGCFAASRAAISLRVFQGSSKWSSVFLWRVIGAAASGTSSGAIFFVLASDPRDMRQAMGSGDRRGQCLHRRRRLDRSRCCHSRMNRIGLGMGVGPSWRRRCNVPHIGSPNKVHRRRLLGHHDDVDGGIRRHLATDQHRKVTRRTTPHD